MLRKKEEGKKDLPQFLTAKKSDFSSWYNQILSLAEIIDKRYEVKGCFVWLNYGYEIMLNLKKEWDQLFKEHGLREMYFPLLVPKQYAEINTEWWEGFKEEAFWVKGLTEKEANYILRPTGEPAMYPMFKLWIRSYRDLPLRIYETVSSFRYETKHTRPIIRDREITVWYEIHTAHATRLESTKEIELHMRMIDELWKKCALVPLKVKKPSWECFPGAIGALEYYSFFPNGKALENGSFNNLGQAYAKKFDLKFKDKEGKERYVWMTCTGNGARLLVAVFAIHGDDQGLILPPTIAPLQIRLIPIYQKETKTEVIRKTKNLLVLLKKEGFRVDADLRERITPGSKFYEQELKGIPLRIEIGTQEIRKRTMVLVRRDTRKKKEIKERDLILFIKKELKDIQENLLKKAKKDLKEKIVFIREKEKVKKIIDDKKIAKVYWCGSKVCWDKIKEIKEGIELFGTSLEKVKGKKGLCLICQKEVNTQGYIATTY